MDSDVATPAITPSDRDLMVRTVIGEAGNQPDVSKVAVAHTILNRLASGQYGQTASDVVTAPGQFEPWQSKAGQLMSYSQGDPAYQQAARAVDMAVSGQAPDPTGGALNFYSPTAQAALGRSAPAWAQGPAVQIGAHLFYGGKGGQQQQAGGSSSVASKNDPAEISDVDIEALMRGKSASTAASTAPASAAPASVPQSAPVESGELSDDDIGALLTGNATRAKAAGQGQPVDASAAGARPLTIHAGGPGTQPGPQAQFGTLDGAKAALQPDATYAQGGDAAAAVGRGVINGLPIVGPYALAGVNKLAAAARAITKDEPYSQALGEVQQFGDQTAANSPNATTMGNALGNVAAYGALGSTAAGARMLGITGDNLLLRAAAGGVTGAAINGSDAAVRSGGDPAATTIGAGIGAAGGILGPFAGKAIEAGGNALAPYVTGFMPAKAAPNALLSAIQGTGGDLPTMAQRLADNPRLSIMDVNPGARNIAQGLAAQPGAARDTLVQAYTNRAGSAQNAVTGAYDAAMGPTPDVLATLNGIKQTAATNAKQGFGQALANAGPVDLSSTIQSLDDQIRPGVGQLSSVQSGIPLGPVQQRLQQIRNMITTPDGSEMLTDPARLHALQSQLRTEADTLTSSSSGSDRLMGKAVMGARNNIVGAIDDATGGQFKPAQQQYADDMSVNDAFNKGLSIFQNRAGVSGLEDRPEYWRSFVANASPAEQQALTLGVRTAADQAMGSVRNAALKGETIPQAGFNLDKLKAVLGDDGANTLAKRMSDEQDIAATNRALFDGSQTQPRQQAKMATIVREIGPMSMEIGLPSFAAMTGNPLTAAALSGAAIGRRALQYAGQQADLGRNALQANMLSATGPARDAAMNRLYGAAMGQGMPTFAQGAGVGANKLLSAAIPSGASEVMDLHYGRVKGPADLQRKQRAHLGL